MSKFIKNVKAFFKNRLNTFQKVLTVFGCIIGFITAIVLIISGVAAIPFTGGASLLPTCVGIPIFILLVTAGFGSAGNYVGVSIDTLLEKEKPNNEKLATCIGCIIGLIISLIGIPLHFVGLPIISQNALGLWKLLFPFIPLTVNAFGSACSKLGKAIDACTNGKTILDIFKSKPKKVENTANIQSIIPLSVVENASFPSNKICRTKKLSSKKSSILISAMPNIHAQLIKHRATNHKMKSLIVKNERKFERGINYYLYMSRHKNNQQNFFSNRHGKCGIIRAKVYKSLYKNTYSSFQRKIIAYSLFASRDGKTLQKYMCQSIGYQSLKAAKKAIQTKIKATGITANKIEILNKFVIKPIILNANTKKSFSSGAYDEALDILKSLDPSRKFGS